MYKEEGYIDLFGILAELKIRKILFDDLLWDLFLPEDFISALCRSLDVLKKSFEKVESTIPSKFEFNQIVLEVDYRVSDGALIINLLGDA